ncbi:MAG: hypothetical protein JW795_13765 [Chitinivibrionales bacterium]|nr:hypothetical protein [Chitinivibrionales bacterium]
MHILPLLQLSLAALLINNLILFRFLGICPLLGVSKNVAFSLGMGAAVTFVLSITAVCTWIINTMLLRKLAIDYLSLFVFIVTIAVIVQLLEMVMMKYSPLLADTIGIYLPILTTNCAILGISLINTDINPFTSSPYTLLEAFLNAVMSGVGYTLVLLLMAGIRQRLDLCTLPKPLQGLPIAFLCAGLMALAFLGFSGLTLLPHGGQ